MTVARRLAPWIVGAIVLTISLAAIYLTAQQLDRSGADDAPQRLATQLASVPRIPQPDDTEQVDLASSEALFWVVYDNTGAPLAGTGSLDGTLATVPSGVIAAAASNGANSVTWQPRDGLRFATVAVAAGNRVVLAGQSLAPSENRTDRIGLMLMLGWLAGIAVLGAGAWVHARAERLERVVT